MQMKENYIMKIAMGNDHTAISMKEAVKAHLETRGIEVLDLGTNSTESLRLSGLRRKSGKGSCWRRGGSGYCDLRNWCWYFTGSK